MDRLEFLKDPEFAKLSIEEAAAKVDRFALLAAACELADSDDFEGAEAAFKTASTLFHPQDDWIFNALYGAARCQVEWSRKLRMKAAEKRGCETP